MEKPEMELIDKLFNCMTEFYGDRWTKQFDRFLPEALVKTVWQSALTGCTYDQIRRVLVLLKQSSKNPDALPPHHVEFFRYARGTSTPIIAIQPKLPSCDPAIARRALDEIKTKLYGRVGSTWNAN